MTKDPAASLLERVRALLAGKPIIVYGRRAKASAWTSCVACNEPVDQYAPCLETSDGHFAHLDCGREVPKRRRT